MIREVHHFLRDQRRRAHAFETRHAARPLLRAVHAARVELDDAVGVRQPAIADAAAMKYNPRLARDAELWLLRPRHAVLSRRIRDAPPADSGQPRRRTSRRTTTNRATWCMRTAIPRNCTTTSRPSSTSHRQRRQLEVEESGSQPACLPSPAGGRRCRLRRQDAGANSGAGPQGERHGWRGEGG